MKKTLYILIGLMAFSIWSCSPEEPPCCDPDPVEEVSEMTITINHKFGDADLEIDNGYTLPSKEAVTFSRLSYLLSNFYLVKMDDTKVKFTEQYAHMDVKSGKTSVTITDVPMGEYKSFGFSVGMDSFINHGNPNFYPTDHALSPINNSLHWNWSNGYIFTAIEGKTTDNNSSFSFHLAGSGNKTDFTFPVSVSKKEPALNATLEYNLEEMFIYPQLYTISIDGSTAHSVTSPVTTKLFANMVDVFTLKSITE